MSQQKTTRPKNTIAAGGKAKEDDDSELDDQAESDPKYDRGQTDKTMTAPRGQRASQSNGGTGAEHMAHRPIKRGTMHRR
jgi:hypothetical protein